jgi:hypothetical protein
MSLQQVHVDEGREAPGQPPDLDIYTPGGCRRQYLTAMTFQLLMSTFIGQKITEKCERYIEPLTENNCGEIEAYRNPDRKWMMLD